MPIGTEVGYKVPGHIVLDGDPAPPEKRGTTAPHFRPMIIVAPNGWMDQDATWYGGRPRPRRHCVRLGPGTPAENRHSNPPRLAHVYCGQTVSYLSNCCALVFYNLLLLFTLLHFNLTRYPLNIKYNVT